MSASRQTYSYSDNIALLGQSVKELYRLCKQFKTKENGEVFIVRVKMMEMLAQQTFKYSIAVSYLKDTEYAKVADILDNVYLYLSRVDVRNMASQYGSIATHEYDVMCGALDLIDERLKTVKVACYGKRRCLPKKIVAPKRVSSLNPLAKDWVPKTQSTQKEWTLKGLLNPEAKEWMPTPLPEKTPEQKETDKKCASFNTKINALVLTLHELNGMNDVYDPETKLTMQCGHLRDMFNCITENKEILNDPRYHQPTSKTTIYKCSFIEISLIKADTITNEINGIYNRLRNSKPRANPSLRAIKIEALESIKRGQLILKSAQCPSRTTFAG